MRPTQPVGGIWMCIVIHVVLSGRPNFRVGVEPTNSKGLKSTCVLSGPYPGGAGV